MVDANRLFSLLGDDSECRLPNASGLRVQGVRNTEVARCRVGNCVEDVTAPGGGWGDANGQGNKQPNKKEDPPPKRNLSSRTARNVGHGI